MIVLDPESKVKMDSRRQGENPRSKSHNFLSFIQVNFLLVLAWIVTLAGMHQDFLSLCVWIQFDSLQGLSEAHLRVYSEQIYGSYFFLRDQLLWPPVTKEWLLGALKVGSVSKNKVELPKGIKTNPAKRRIDSRCDILPVWHHQQALFILHLVFFGLWCLKPCHDFMLKI